MNKYFLSLSIISFVSLMNAMQKEEIVQDLENKTPLEIKDYSKDAGVEGLDELDNLFKPKKKQKIETISEVKKPVPSVKISNEPWLSPMTYNLLKGAAIGVGIIAVGWGIKELYNFLKRRTFDGMPSDQLILNVQQASEAMRSLVQPDVEKISELSNMQNPEIAAQLKHLSPEERAQALMMQQVMMQVSASYTESRHKAFLSSQSISGLPFLEHASLINAQLQNAERLMFAAKRRIEKLATDAQGANLDDLQRDQIESDITELSESLQQLTNDSLLATAALLMLVQSYEFGIEQAINKKAGLIKFTEPYVMKEFAEQLDAFAAQQEGASSEV